MEGSWGSIYILWYGEGVLGRGIFDGLDGVVMVFLVDGFFWMVWVLRFYVLCYVCYGFSFLLDINGIFIKVVFLYVILF